MAALIIGFVIVVLIGIYASQDPEIECKPIAEIKTPEIPKILYRTEQFDVGTTYIHLTLEDGNKVTQKVQGYYNPPDFVYSYGLYTMRYLHPGSLYPSDIRAKDIIAYGYNNGVADYKDPSTRYYSKVRIAKIGETVPNIKEYSIPYEVKK